MAHARGSNTVIAVGIEPSYGTVPTGFGTNKKAVVIPYSSCNLSLQGNRITSNLIKSTRNPVKSGRGNKSPSGTLSTLLTPHMYPLWSYILGKRLVVDSYTSPQTIVNNVQGYTATGENAAAIANETAPYTSTFSIGELPSFTTEVRYAGLGTQKNHQYLGCCVNTATIKIPNEGFLGLDLNIMAANEVITSSVGNVMSYSGGTDYLLEYEHRPFDAFEISSSGGVRMPAAAASPSASYASAAAFSGALSDVAFIHNIGDITINNNLDGDAYVIGGGGIRQSLSPGVVSVSGSLKVMFTDTGSPGGVSLLTDASNDVEKCIVIKIVRGTGAGTADNETMYIVIPELSFSLVSPVIEGPAGIYAEMKFQAHYEDTSVNSITSAIHVVAINSDAPRL